MKWEKKGRFPIIDKIKYKFKWWKYTRLDEINRLKKKIRKLILKWPWLSKKDRQRMLYGINPVYWQKNELEKLRIQ
jgi:hypothetical protein